MRRSRGWPVAFTRKCLILVSRIQIASELAADISRHRRSHRADLAKPREDLSKVTSRLIAGEQFSKDSKSLLESRLGIFSVPDDSGSACFQFEANFMRLFGK
jgi:hypothetical protein